jgi:ribonucleoside-triphosphate reductase
MVKKIRKRDGRVVYFDKEKIAEAIWKAVKSVGGNDKERANYISELVEKQLNKIYGNEGIPHVEEIQDLVEKTLIEEGHYKVGKAYILYRKTHEELRDVQGLFDTIEVIDDYIGLNDWAIKENSNKSFSLQGLNNYIASKIVSKYWMRRIYPEAVRKAHEMADIHIHDLDTLGAYCVGWDLKDLLMIGFKGVPGKLSCNPAKHLSSALGQIVNFFYTLQGESAGAQAFSNFDTLLAPFIRYDNLNYSQVKKIIQSFLFNMAVPTRVGFQTPFTNITMDLEVPNYMKDEPVIIGGKPQAETYKEFKHEMEMLNRAFAECMIEGDADGRVFTFPIPTYNITKDFNWENPAYEVIWEMTAKYGIPYFSNFINSDMKPEDSRSMCCRLRLDQTELRKRGGGLFGSNPLTGSIGVVTVNLARLGFTSLNEEVFFEKLSDLMELAKESLEIKRKEIERLTEKGLYPYSKFYLRNVKKSQGEYWKNHFGTIGLLGMNESIMNFMPG